jgi:hypothetical protein
MLKLFLPSNQQASNWSNQLNVALLVLYSFKQSVQLESIFPKKIDFICVNINIYTINDILDKENKDWYARKD